MGDVVAGRLLAISGDTITLDEAYKFEPSKSYGFEYRTDDGIFTQGSVVNPATGTDVVETDTWDAAGPLAPMPTGVNHAAAVSDGTRLWVFGGRQGGNWPQPGFDLVQVYDPATDTWDSSDQPGSTLAPMPLPRGGTGKAACDPNRKLRARAAAQL